MPLERVLGPELGAIYRDMHADHGVEMLLGTGVEAFEGDGRGRARAHRRTASAIECDFVVVGVGVSRATELAAAAGLESTTASLVDEHLRTSARGIFAAGDVANAHHPFYGRADPRRALGQRAQPGPGRGAQRCSASDVAYDEIPYFFSDQYDVGMEYSGYAPRAGTRSSSAATPRAASSSPSGCNDGRVVAGMNVNVWDVSEPIRALIQPRATVDDARLADPDVPLDELAS